jgi:hypothetical protein
MPFGFCNAPVTFERLMQTVLRGLTSLPYQDDVIVIGRIFQEQLLNLRRVFQRFQEARLKLSPEKCQLFGRKYGTSGILCHPRG